MTTRLAAAVVELAEALAEVARLEAAAIPAAPDRLYGIDETCAMLGLGRSLVYAEIAAGRLHTIRVGRRRLVPAAAVAEFIRERVA